MMHASKTVVHERYRPAHGLGFTAEKRVLGYALPRVRGLELGE